MIVPLTVTFDNPDMDWTITPLLPEDQANWRLLRVVTGFQGNFGFGFVYPTAGPAMSAMLDEVTFTDSQGRVFISTQMGVGDGFCRDGTGVFAGKWLCSEGNNIAYVRTFGDIAESGPLDPILPSLDGPITIHFHMSVAGRSDVPETGSFNVNGGYFNYIFEPVPEPNTALLVMTGLLGLAYRRR